jgi:trimethylamine--corrinoid protein Co-methyltransferase
MAVKGYKRKYKPLELISEEEVEAIHAATVDILKETGVRFESKWAIDFFKKNDCLVNEEDNRVRFPETLIEECIRSAPSNFRVKAREEKYDMVFGRGTLYFQDAPGMHIINFSNLTTQTPTQSEYVDYIKVLDALPTVHGISCYPYFGYQGIPLAMTMPEIMALKFKYTSKFHQCCYSNDSEIFCIKMAKEIGVETLGCLASSPPLSWDSSAVNLVRRFVEADFPIGPVSGSNFGATAPATIAGAVAKTNAELGAMLILIQLLKPGHRILMWRLDFSLNMKTGSPNFGEICASVGNAIYNQMWRYYGIPTGNGTVGFINAKTPDFQSGYEKSLGAVISALSGCSLVQLHGGVMGELTAHPIQAVLDDDIAGMIGRFIEGEIINDETLAVDLIREVGPIPGHYLSCAHTRNWWQKEQFIPKSSDRTPNYKAWFDSGKKNTVDLAKERTRQILETHETSMLSEDKCEVIDKILEEARTYYKKQGML